MSTDPPVLIAGGGPVGMTAALLLANAGIPSVVFEAEAERRLVGSRAICMQRDVLDVLDRIGVAAPMVEEGVTWRRGRTYYREHLLFETTFPETGRSAFPPFINISQSSVEKYLLDRVVDEPLIQLRHARVASVEQHADGVVIQIEHGDGALEPFVGSHLIACDGARSTVRQTLGLSFQGASFHDQFLICDIRAALPFENERLFYFDPVWNPGRQVLVHPQPDSVWRIDWQVPADYDLARDERSGELDKRIRQITGDVPYEIVWKSHYRFHSRVADSMGIGRVLLAGDAGHLMAPFGARGLNSGIQDAENAAWKIAFVRNGWAPDALLDTYNVERRGAAIENLRATETTMAFLVPQDDAEWARRRQVLDRAVHDPEARRSVDSGKLAEPYWYLDSPLTTAAGDTADFPTAPGVARPPVPGVLCPDAPIRVEGRREATRLRHLFGLGFVLLTGPGVDADAARDAATRATAAPVDVLRIDDIDAEGIVSAALETTNRRVHLIRPDGHLAAVLEFEPRELARAVARAGGQHLGTDDDTRVSA